MSIYTLCEMKQGKSKARNLIGFSITLHSIIGILADTACRATRWHFLWKLCSAAMHSKISKTFQKRPSSIESSIESSIVLHLLDMSKLSDRLQFASAQDAALCHAITSPRPRCLPLTFRRDCAASPSSPAETGCCSWRIWRDRIMDTLCHKVWCFVPICEDFRSVATSSVSFSRSSSGEAGSFPPNFFSGDSELLHQLGHSQDVHRRSRRRAWFPPRGWDTFSGLRSKIHKKGCENWSASSSNRPSDKTWQSSLSLSLSLCVGKLFEH